jgi:multisubunit Na+/H+ antiporter MnhG subunit
MSKNRDLALILLIVIIGMFIPFLGSIAINYGVDLTNANSMLKVASTFGYFLLIFAIELIVVFLYFHLTNKIASKKFKKIKP